MNRIRLEYVARIFLAEMRRQLASAHPERDAPALTFDTYPPEHRSALMAGMEKALRAGSPAADQAFETWLEKRVSNDQ